MSLWSRIAGTLLPTFKVGPQSTTLGGPNSQGVVVAGNGAASFVLQPGGTPVGNVFTTWASLKAARDVACPVSSNGTRPPSVILIDDTFGAATVTLTAENLDSTTFMGVANYNDGQGVSLLTIATGSTASWTSLVFENLDVSFAGTAALFAVSGASQEVNLFLRQASLECTSTGALIACSGASSFVWVRGLASQLGDGTHAVFTTSTPGTLEATFLDAGSHVANNALGTSGSGTGTLATVTPPGTQGSGISFVVPNSAFAAIQGAPGQPLRLLPGTPFSVATSVALSSAQQAFPTYELSGTVPGGGSTLTLPNSPGFIAYFGLGGVTLTGTLTFSTGSGTTAAVTAANLAATGQTGVIVQVTGSNIVRRMS